MPFGATCSAVLSAACHRPPGDENAAYLPIQWGVVSSPLGDPKPALSQASPHIDRDFEEEEEIHTADPVVSSCSSSIKDTTMEPAPVSTDAGAGGEEVSHCAEPVIFRRSSSIKGATTELVPVSVARGDRDEDDISSAEPLISNPESSIKGMAMEPVTLPASRGDEEEENIRSATPIASSPHSSIKGATAKAVPISVESFSGEHGHCCFTSFAVHLPNEDGIYT